MAIEKGMRVRKTTSNIQQFFCGRICQAKPSQSKVCKSILLAWILFLFETFESQQNGVHNNTGQIMRKMAYI